MKLFPFLQEKNESYFALWRRLPHQFAKRAFNVRPYGARISLMSGILPTQFPPLSCSRMTNS